MLTSVVMPKLVCRPSGGLPSYTLRLGALGGHYSADRRSSWVCTAEEAGLGGRVRTGPGGGLCAVPVACQNGAETADIECRQTTSKPAPTRKAAVDRRP